MKNEIVCYMGQMEYTKKQIEGMNYFTNGQFEKDLYSDSDYY